MAKRKIIKVNEDKCTGCGLCIPNCPEGALQVIDGKVRLVSDLFCDGLGACIGECPEGAISVEEREAESYDEEKVMANIARQGSNVIKAHLKHLKDYNQAEYYNQALEYLDKNGIDYGIKNNRGDSAKEKQELPCSCPGSNVMDFRKEEHGSSGTAAVKMDSELKQWPVQITLVPSSAPYLNGADLLITADCVPFAYPNFS